MTTPAEQRGRLSRKQRQRRTRDELLEAARSVFAERGFDGASLDEETVLSNFVLRIEGLASGELAAWGARQSQGDSPQNETG